MIGTVLTTLVGGVAVYGLGWFTLRVLSPHSNYGYRTIENKDESDVESVIDLTHDV